jgi:hypothetical protein
MFRINLKAATAALLFFISAQSVFATNLHCQALLKEFLSQKEIFLAKTYERLVQSGVVKVQVPEGIAITDSQKIDRLFEKFYVQKADRKVITAHFGNQLLGFKPDYQKTLANMGLEDFSGTLNHMLKLGESLFPEELAFKPQSFFVIFENSNSLRANSFHADQAVATMVFQIHGPEATGTEFVDFRDVGKIDSLKKLLFWHRVSHVLYGVQKPQAFGFDPKNVKKSVGGKELLVTLGTLGGSALDAPLGGVVSRGYHKASTQEPDQRRIIGILTFE